MSATRPQRWEEESLRVFYKTFHQAGQDWQQVSAACERAADECEALWKQHQQFLSIPSQPALEDAFVAMVADHYNNLKDDIVKQEAVENGGGSGEGSYRRGEDEAGEPGPRGDGEEGAEPQEGDWDHAQAAEGSGRPVRSTRGKPPRQHSPSDEDYRGRGASTPGRSQKGVMASPSSSKLKGGKFKEPESAKKRPRKLFIDSDNMGLTMGDDYEDDGIQQQPPRKSPYTQRWKGKHQQRELEQGGVDALLQLAMAGSMDQDMVDAEGLGDDGGDLDDNGNDGPDRTGSPAFSLPAGTLDRPGKRKVRPPARLNDDGFLSPSKTTQSQGTPRRGRITPTLAQSGAAAFRSPSRITTPRSGTPRDRPGARARTPGGRAARVSRTYQDEDMLYDDQDIDDGGVPEDGGLDGTGLDDGYLDQEPPRSARQARRSVASGLRHADDALQDPSADLQALGPGPVNDPDNRESQPGYDMDQPGLPMPGMPLGVLQLPGLPGGFEGDGLPLPYGPQGLGAPGGGFLGRARRSRRKPYVERAPANDPTTSAQQQHQLFLRSMLGFGRHDAAGAAADAAAAAALPAVPAIPTPERSLQNFLASPSARRWISYEWHYSSLDRAFFMRNEMKELMGKLGIGNVTKMTRGEWALLRGSFGKPRRMSLQFLKEERMKLEAFRQHVRRRYHEGGIGGEVPPELPRPLRVGQEVTARHSVDGQLHDGVILTLKGDFYRVQFHRPDLMTDVVADTNVMPCDPRENVPAIYSNLPLIINGRSLTTIGGGQGPLARSKGKVAVGAGGASLPLPRAGVGLAQPAGGLAPLVLPGVQAAVPQGVVPMGMVPVGAGGGQGDTEMDAALIAEVSQKLEAKEALIAELKELNRQSGSHMDPSGQHNEAFQMHYTQTVLQLKEINAALEAAYIKLQSRSSTAALSLLNSSAGAAGTAAQPAVAASALSGNILNLSLEALGLGPVATEAIAPLVALPPPHTPTDFAARAVVYAAYSDARAVVDRCRAARAAAAAATAANTSSNAAPDAQQQNPQQAPQGTTAADTDIPAATTTTTMANADANGNNNTTTAASATTGPAQQAATDTLSQGVQGTGAAGPAVAAPMPPPVRNAGGSVHVDRLITSCITVLCTLQRCVSENITAPTIDASMDLAAKMLEMNSTGKLKGSSGGGEGEGGVAGANNPNAPLYNQLLECIQTLKSQLVRAA